MASEAFPASRGVKRYAFGWQSFLASNEVGLLAVIAVFALVFAYANPGFTSPFNLYALSRVLAIDVVIGFSMMVVLVTGGLNLAVGSIAVSAVMVGGYLMQVAGLPIPLAVVLAIAFGTLLGWINGFLTVRMRVHSFIVTLATMSIFFGAMILATQADAFNELPRAFIGFGKERVFGFVSILLFVALAVWLGLVVLFHLTGLGRELLAAGASPAAARISGLRVDRATIICHSLSGGLATLAGLMLTMRNGAALPSMAGHIGSDWLLPAFLAPVLGGTLLTGGVVSVTGTLLGATLVTVLTNGLLQLQIGEFWVQLFLGLVLLLAVTLNSLRRAFTWRPHRAAS